MRNGEVTLFDNTTALTGDCITFGYDHAKANNFTLPPGQWDITSITVRGQYYSLFGGGANEYWMAVWSDPDHNGPDEADPVLWKSADFSLPTGDFGDYTVDNPGLTLAGGIEYWLVLGSDNPNAGGLNGWWQLADTGEVGYDGFYSYNNTPPAHWEEPPTQYEGALKISGTPEPVTVTLLALGLPLGLLARRRRKES